MKNLFNKIIKVFCCAKLFSRTLATLVSTILFSGIFLMGCSIFNSTFKDEPAEVSFSGILTAQTDEDLRQGTHFLLTEDKEEILLNSIAINLSGKQYLGNKVTVIGILDDQTDVLAVSGVSILEVLSDATLNSDLAEYKNTDLGFKISYYSDWKLMEDPENVSFVAPSETGYFDMVSIDQFSFSYTPKMSEDGASDTPLQAYFLERRPDITDLDTRMRKIGVDQVDAAHFETKDGGTEYYLYRNGLIYKISFLPGGMTKNLDENERIFNEMIDSFQFLGFTVDETGTNNDPIDSADLEIPEIDMEMSFFESSPYHFRASYPTSWYYAGSLSSDPNILHHYALSDEPIEGTDELIDLDVWAGDMPSQTVQRTATTLTIYTTVDEQVYRVLGDIKYEDLITYIAQSIQSIPKD